MSYIFGPVPSRRLGLSLGIDLIPSKTCTFDCLYCQVGRTTHKTLSKREYVPVQEIIGELEKRLKKTKPDTITLAGSGEPTLYEKIDQVIDAAKKMSDARVALLTNGSLLWKKEVRDRVSGADIIMPTLSTVFEETFRAMHRPHSELDLSKIIDGLKALRQDYRGKIFLEVVLLAGFNDTDKEIEALKGVIDEISPDKIQLNTVVRPPSDQRAISLDRQRLENIKIHLGNNAEIIAHVPLDHTGRVHDSRVMTILEMAKRRPVRSVDIAHVLNVRHEEVEALLKELLIKGSIREQEHLGERFFICHP